ncbi:hypothetical protein Ancab_027329 [Ancistrocladus abbreviatus]
MTSTNYYSFQPSLLVDLNEDQVIPHNHDHQQLALKLHHASSSPSSPLFFNSSQDQAGYYFMGSHRSSNHQEQVDDFSTYGDGLSYYHKVEESKIEGDELKISIWKKEEQSENGSTSVKWMSSKMRLMKKTIIKPGQINCAETAMIGQNMVKYEDHKQKPSLSSPKETAENIDSPNNNTGTTIRVCADCNTTKTPLWRSGPRGPKSLCNACGIRQRKARRAMAAAAAAAAGTNIPAMKSSSKVQHKEKGSSSGFGLQQKKRSKMTSSQSRNQKKLCFEEFALNLTKKLSLHQVFPQEEKEAAILLMALSYGLVHG